MPLVSGKKCITLIPLVDGGELIGPMARKGRLPVKSWIHAVVAAVAKWHAKNQKYNAKLAYFKAHHVTENEIANPTVYFAYDY